jgi:leucyl-tRNA synthetase
MKAGTAYDPAELEPRWNARWEQDRLFEFDVQKVPAGEKFYNLVEFPYPSAEGLHVGHVYTYCGADTYGRYQRMRGRKVFEPMGFDSFGIHTENYALRVGEHPRTLTARTIEHYRQQLRRVGAAWSWKQEVVTSDPSYYRWTQWLFVQLYRAGLAVRAKAPVIWCPSCLTVLANEQVEGDRCERCHTTVTERIMEQWFLRITAYADALLEGLDTLDWPELAKRMQRDWIGRSRGVEIDFAVEGRSLTLTAFTTRADTLFGATFLVVSPQHPVAAELGDGGRTPAGNEPGRATRAQAVNPGNGRRIPIYVADYVVAAYGTGVVMGVPAHDTRDWEFANALGLPVVQVLRSDQAPANGAWTGEGILVDSGPFSGMESTAAREAIADWLQQHQAGRRTTRYRLHDWLISRQRYWGPPIPIIYCERCGTVPVPEDQLPVLLPEVRDFRPTGTGVSPLATAEAFVQTQCPQCGGPGRRETDVSDTFLDSAWYFLRYPSADVETRPWDPERTARLLPVDLYAGGKEHVMRHHLYARFVVRAMHDLGHVPFAEPFPRLRLHGLLNQEGAKMSKSKGNVVNPDDYIEQVGADNLRMYLLFCGAWEEGGNFSDLGLMGIVRFTARTWRVLSEEHRPGPGGVDLRTLDRYIQRVGHDVERFKFNTAISRLMELVTWLAQQKPRMSAAEWDRSARTVVLLLAPFGPYLAEELWAHLGGAYSVHAQPWPTYDAAAVREDEITLVVQVNGKLRDRFSAPAGLAKEEAVRLVLEREAIRRHLGAREPREVVFVPDRLVNLVA